MMFKKYLVSKKNDINILKYRKLNNVNVIAIILVESYYRKPLFRFIEYLYWIITGNSEVTLGLSQMKVKYIRIFNNINMLQRTKYIIKLESYMNNYYLVESYLNKNSKLDFANDNAICKYYNGVDSNEYYVKCFKEAKSYIENGCKFNK